MLLSLLVYTLSALIFYFLGLNLARGDKYYQTKKPFWSIEILVIIFVFAFIAGARYRVGADHFSYMTTYEHLQDYGWQERDTFEPGFYFIMENMAGLGIHYSFFFALWAIIQIFFIYFALRRKKYLYPYIGLVLMLSPFFFTLMNGIRQAVVMCIFGFLVEYIKDRKFIPYLLGILIGCTIHKSAILLLPLYFIFYKDFYFKKVGFNIVLLIICTLLGTLSIGTFLSDSLSRLFSILDYKYYSENVDLILSDIRSHSWGPVKIILFVTDLILIILFPKVKKYFDGDRLLVLYFNLFFIGACWENLFADSLILSRPAMYFKIFRLFILAYTIYYLKASHNQIKYKSFLMLSCSYIYLALLKTYILFGNAPSIIYYNFFFTK